MKRIVWLYWGAVALAGVAAVVGLVLSQRPLDLTRLDLSQAPQAGAEVPVRLGSLGPKYLTAEELARLKLDIDLERVPYRADVDLERWAFALFIDAIPAISRPSTTTVAETDSWLHPDDLVLSLSYRGRERAYPIRILEAHEIVNDTLEGEPLLVTYCPLCGSGVVFRRPLVAGRPLEFGVSGRLYLANLLMYDRTSATLWHQLTGEPLAGPLVGKAGPLERLPADIVPWQVWKAAHPGGEVLARPRQVTTPRGTFQRTAADYERYRYEDYRLKQGVGFGVDVRDLDLRGMSAKRKVVGLQVDGVSKAYVAFMLKDLGLLHDVVAGRPVLVGIGPDGETRAFLREVAGQTLSFHLEDGELVDEQSGSRWDWDGRAVTGIWAEQGAQLERLVVTPAYWFAWVALHPQTELFAGQS